MKIICLFFIILFFLRCGVDPEITTTVSNCPSINELIELLDYDENDISVGDEFLSSDTGAVSAIYSLSNPEKIISYYSGYLSSYQGDLIQYDIDNKSYSTILSNPGLFSLPVVSCNNWLLFTDSDFQLWKVKIDGDSLTQITSEGMNFQSEWAPDGRSLIYSTTALSGFYNAVIADKNGNTLAILPSEYSIDLPSWSQNMINIAYKDNDNNLQLLNTETWETNLLYANDTNNPNKQILSIDFFPDSRDLLWVTKTNIYKTNIASGATSIWASTCESEGFDFVNISPDGKNMLIKKTIYQYYDSKHLILSSKIFLYNDLGVEVKEIVF